MRAPFSRLRRYSHVVHALRHRNYRLFFAGQAISLIGLWMTRIATQWLVYRLTDSEWMLGLVGFMQLAPAFCISPIAGTLVDRTDKRRVLVITQLGAMATSLTLAGLALSGTIQIWHILVLCAAEGAVRGFEIPARQALVVDLVGDRRDLSNAIALNSTVFNGARMVGPALGALAVATAGEGLCFLVDGLSYGAVVIALLAMRLPAHVGRERPKSVLHDMVEGFQHVLGFAPYRALLLLAGCITLLGAGPQMALMSAFAKKALGGDERTLGMLMSASGAGALTAGIYLATRRSVRGLGRIIAFCAVGFGVMLAVFATSHMVWLSMLSLYVCGFAVMVLMAGSNTIIQTLVDDDKRGRVMALFVMTFTGSAPLGQLLGGTAAEHFGPRWTVGVGAALCALAGLAFARQLPGLRHAARPLLVERGILAEDDQPAPATVSAPR